MLGRACAVLRPSFNLHPPFPFFSSLSLSASGSASALVASQSAHSRPVRGTGLRTEVRASSGVASTATAPPNQGKPGKKFYNVCKNCASLDIYRTLLMFRRPPFGTHVLELPGADCLRGLRCPRPSAQPVPEPRPEASQGIEDPPEKVFPLWRGGPRGKGVQGPLCLLRVRGRGPPARKLP
ncbi:hypothetical protein DFH06DRAFT_608499 [Mycena polygramma]|nr:hypothetical protein DFH06DRAFT_608499 [Mycena polygramma]